MEAGEYFLFFFLGLFFDPEDGGTTFFRNLCKLLPNNKTPNPMRQMIY
jgi:hypothetical protein